MKKHTVVLIAFIFSAITSFGRPMYLPSQSISVTTLPIADTHKCSARVALDSDSRFITQASLRIGKEIYYFPLNALTGIEYPDLNSIRIEIEQGVRGGLWYSIVLSPSEKTEHATWFHISVVDGVFRQVTKKWREPKEDHIKTHHEILYKNNE